MRVSTASAVFFTLTTPALANDSIATLGAGGLELIQADTISMEQERLYLSVNKVTVDYVFINRSRTPESYLIAFPMPLIEPVIYNEGDMPIADREADNFLNFSITVDGKAVEPQLEMRALSGPLDITDQLKTAGLPLNPLQQKTLNALSALPKDVAAKLEELGAIGDAAGTPYPRWTLKATYYWQQTFPAGEELHVSHAYQPGTGVWFYYPETLDDPDIVRRFCIDEGTSKAIRRGTRDGREMVLAHEVRYVLSTGANWHGPISDFRLIVDKGSPDAIVSLCMDGVKKISPTQFEVVRTDFAPRGDLAILVVTPAAKE